MIKTLLFLILFPVFGFNKGNWTQIGNALLRENTGVRFEYSIGLSKNGTTLAVGTINNETSGSNAGQVCVFENTSLSTVDFENNTVSFYPNPEKDVVNFLQMWLN